MVDPSQIRAAEVVLPCRDLDRTLAFFTQQLGFRVERIAPADDPAVAVVAGHGVRLRLDRRASGSPGTLHLRCDVAPPGGASDGPLLAPNGTEITFGPPAAPIDPPPLRPAFVLERMGRIDGRGGWGAGRAGMQYRDLIPDRQGGRFVASHIRITEGGAVADYVHYHRIRFQLIYCYRGWVRVVYEDQGAPFTMQPGDCVLQPPEIRHRVLESSAGLEVIEITCPAEHDTLADHELTLPTPTRRSQRAFAGQAFVRHVAASAPSSANAEPGFLVRDLGLGQASGGLTGGRVLRRSAGAVADRTVAGDSELAFTFVLAGSATLDTSAHGRHALGAGDAVVIPPGERYRLDEPAADLELLEVSVPA